MLATVELVFLVEKIYSKKQLLNLAPKVQQLIERISAVFKT
jgi:hypothetical protein